MGYIASFDAYSEDVCNKHLRFSEYSRHVSQSRPDLKGCILDSFEDDKPHHISEVVTDLLDASGLRSEQARSLAEWQHEKLVRDVIEYVKRLMNMSLLSPVQNKSWTYERTNMRLSDAYGPPIYTPTPAEAAMHEEQFWNDFREYYLNFSKPINKPKPKPKFGLISFLDVLGTKELWKDSKWAEIPKDWNNFTSEFKHMVDMGCTETKLRPTFRTFSDTIIIAIEGSKNSIKSMLNTFAFAAGGMVYRSIRYGLPIRGCFSIGAFFNNDDFFIGKPVSEVADNYELPQWIGISAAPTANAIINKMPDFQKYLPHDYCKYDIPLRDSIGKDIWALDWAFWAAMETVEKGEPCIIELIDQKLKQINDTRASSKWKNTRDFLLRDNWID